MPRNDQRRNRRPTARQNRIQEDAFANAFPNDGVDGGGGNVGEDGNGAGAIGEGLPPPQQPPAEPEPVVAPAAVEDMAVEPAEEEEQAEPLLEDEPLEEELEDDNSDDEEDDDDPPLQQEQQGRMNAIRDSVVSTSTLKSYVSELLHLLQWARVNRPNWLTESCMAKMVTLASRHDLERMRSYNARIKATITDMCREARSCPLLFLDRVTPEGFMLYISQLRNKSTGTYLGKSSCVVPFVPST